MKMTITCASKDPRAIRAAQVFPERLRKIHGDKIILRDSAVYTGNGTAKESYGKGIDVSCSICGHEWSPVANTLLKGIGCPECKRLQSIATAGKRRAPRSTPQEKARAAELRAQGLSYKAIGNELGRSDGAIRLWLDSVAHEENRLRCAAYKEAHPERNSINSKRYFRTEHGKAGSRVKNANRRLLHTNTPEYVFLDNEWCEVDRKLTWSIWSAQLLPAKERKEMQELYLEAQYLTEKTGVEYHIDHIHPLSLGGEHRLYNLQLLTAQENLSKSNTFSIEDQAELCKRLFN